MDASSLIWDFCKDWDYPVRRETVAEMQIWYQGSRFFLHLCVMMNELKQHITRKRSAFIAAVRRKVSVYPYAGEGSPVYG